MDQFDAFRMKAAIDVAIRMLSHRLVRLLALVMTCVLFAWAMRMATWLHFAIAGAFALAVFLPVLWATSRPDLLAGDTSGQ